MKMKRNLILVIFVMVTFMAATLPVIGDYSSSEDYKVIKKAVKGKKKSGDIAWFRIEVTDKKTKKTTVKIRLPIGVVDLLADCDKDIKIDDGKCKLNLKKIIAELKKNGPMTLIEVDDDDAFVRIWFE
jgi:hypothetical protein